MKKLLSIILAIVMIAAMLPSAFAATASEEYEYVFKLEALGSQASDGYRSKLATMTLETPLPSVSDKWKVATSRFLYNVYSQKEGILWNGDKRYATGGNSMFAVEIWVPTDGTYKPSLNYSAIQSAPVVDIYLVKEGTEAGGCYPSDFQFVTSGDGDAKTSTFIRALGDGYKLGHVDMWGGSTTTDYGNIKTIDFNDLELQLDGNSNYYLCFHTVNLNDNHVGTSSNTYYNVNLESFKLTPAYTAEAYTTSGKTTVTALAAYGNGNTIEDTSVISVGNVAYGEKCKVSVNNKKVVKEGKTYNFLYWAKGMTSRENELALSTAESFDYIPQDGNNVLIAVYEEAGTDEAATFYNANGQLLTDIEFNKTTLPALPSMAGYTAPATAWVQLGNDTELKSEDAVPVTGDKIFIAKYNDADKKSDISVTVSGASADSIPTGKYAYGKEIICKADAPEGKVFMYWTKTVGGTTEAEVVSMEEDYSFYAWEDCEVTAVYGTAKHALAKDVRKIIISSVVAGNENAIMAEFIGFEDALEKGVMIGDQKIAMTTKDNQFTVVTDDDVTGYAIVVDATDGYTQITDK